MMDYSFLNFDKLIKRKKFVKNFGTFGSVLGAICIFGIIDGIFNPESSISQYQGTYWGVLLISIGIALLAFFRARKNRLAERYNEYFLSDIDGVATIREIADFHGISEEKALKDVRKLFKDSYFHGCAFRDNDNPCVIITRSRKEYEASFVPMVCSSCGASFSARRGHTTKCGYCGKEHFVSGENED